MRRMNALHVSSGTRKLRDRSVLRGGSPVRDLFPGAALEWALRWEVALTSSGGDAE
jgi:hypothetical protein